MNNTNNIEEDNIDTANNKKCKEGSELNPKTKRCVKVCPDDFIRDDNFKCKSNKKIKRESEKLATILEPENVDVTTDNPLITAITNVFNSENKTKKIKEKCPKGTKKNRKTGLCEPVNINTSKSTDNEYKNKRTQKEYDEVKLKKYEDRLKNETDDVLEDKTNDIEVKKKGRTSNTISSIISELEKKTGIKYTTNDFIYNKEKVFTKDDYLNINSRSVRDIYHILQLKDPQDKYVFLNIFIKRLQRKEKYYLKIYLCQSTYKHWLFFQNLKKI